MEINRNSQLTPDDQLEKPQKNQSLFELPPPIPLINKTFQPLDPAIHIGDYPFM
jgi:hypothetical protein